MLSCGAEVVAIRARPADHERLGARFTMQRVPAVALEVLDVCEIVRIVEVTERIHVTDGSEVQAQVVAEIDGIALCGPRSVVVSHEVDRVAKRRRDELTKAKEDAKLHCDESGPAKSWQRGDVGVAAKDGRRKGLFEGFRAGGTVGHSGFSFSRVIGFFCYNF